MALQFGVLGPLEVTSDGEALAVRGATRRALLAYLLVHAGEVHSLDRIIEALSSSEATVQTYVSQLRKLFGTDGPTLEHRAGGYVLDVDPNAVDASRFEVAVTASSAIEDRDRRIVLLEEALMLWRDTPLVEFAGNEWADQRARQWTRLFVLAHQLRASALLDAARHRDALPILENLVASHPLHEPYWALLVVARYRCGQPADALAALSEARNVLATELGVEPGPELVALEHSVLTHDPTLETPEVATSSPPDAVSTVIEPLPDGVVTFMLTDIEGSTALWDSSPGEMGAALARHEDITAHVVETHGGRLLKSRGEGDSTFSVFSKPTDAVAAAVMLQRRFADEAWPGDIDLPTRVAVHTGEAQRRGGDYFGGTVNRAARIRSLAAGGQVLVSRAVHDVVVDGLPPDVEFVAFGEHSMRGLRRSESIYAITGAGLDAQPRMAGDARSARPRTSFVGRSGVVQEIELALHESTVVTLVGPGGIGKTRLALETASGLYARERVSRVCVAELAPVSDPSAVPSLIAAAIGVHGTDVVASIAAAFGNERALLVLDNCEHLVDECSRIVAELVDATPTLRVLATSRVPLDLPFETIVPVEPLTDDAAIRLLFDRAGRDLSGPDAPEWTSAREIVRRLDCIPLALELTGARLRSITAVDLLARLRVLDTSAKRPSEGRHATMRATLDWSYALLAVEERVVLRRLSVFSGFTVEAAERVASDGEQIDAEEVPELIDQLVSQSFVVFDTSASRYRLLEPVRQYAGELLDHDEDADAVHDRHTAYFLEAAQRVARAQGSGNQSQTELDDDEHNIEAALEWSKERHDDDTLCRLVAALGFFWLTTNADQGVRWTRRTAAEQRDIPRELRAAVLVAAGQVTQVPADDAAVDAWLDEAVTIYRDLGRNRSLAWALSWHGRTLALRDPVRAKSRLDEALALFRASDDIFGAAWAIYFLSMVAFEAGDDDASLALVNELVQIAESQVPALLGAAYSRATFAAMTAGNDEDALRYIAAAEEQSRSGDRFSLVNLLYNRSWIESLVGTRARALRALGQAMELDRMIGLGDARIFAGLGAYLLIDDDPESARELLYVADLLQGGHFRPFREQWARERAQKIEARLDLRPPSTNRFRTISDAMDWVLQWISEQLADREL